MSQYLKSQIQEIKDSPALSLYGIFLSLTHLWTWMHWNQGDFFINAQAGLNSEPLCFPWFANCDVFRASLSTESWQIVLTSYLVLTVATIGFFFSRKLTALAWGSFFTLTLFKLFLHLSNYNFMGNYHYMIHFISLAFLFYPRKILTAKVLLVLFYVAAGLLKLNIDWLSGAAMIRSPYIRGDLLRLSLFYVIFLELFFVFGLLHHNRWVRWACLVQLLAFHAFSWHIVGFFYPMVMFSLLMVFFIDEYREFFGEIKIPDHLTQLFTFKESRSLYVMVVFFTLLQILPFFLVSDPSLSGVARLSSLNMFDSKTQCHSLMIAETSEGSMHITPPSKNLGVRLSCDPLVFLNQAHQLCRQNKESNEMKKLSFALFSKRVTAKDYKKVLSFKNICELKNPLWAELAGGDQ